MRDDLSVNSKSTHNPYGFTGAVFQHIWNSGQ